MRYVLCALALSCLLIAPGTAQPKSPVVPLAPAAASGPESYRLGAGDEIRVTVFNEPDLKVEQKIAAEGEINMPLIGDVKAAGMTSAQLADSIETRLRTGFLRDPNVSVTVISYRPFYVIGEVAKPGSYPYTADLTVASAIATAGGFARGADRGGVWVRRVGQSEEQKLKMNDRIALQPGDTVRVGRSALSNLRELPLGIFGLIP